MTKPKFAAMSKIELKRYLLENRNDTEAFHALMDKISVKVFKGIDAHLRLKPPVI